MNQGPQEPGIQETDNETREGEMSLMIMKVMMTMKKNMMMKKKNKKRKARNHQIE